MTGTLSSVVTLHAVKDLTLIVKIVDAGLVLCGVITTLIIPRKVSQKQHFLQKSRTGFYHFKGLITLMSSVNANAMKAIEVHRP